MSDFLKMDLFMVVENAIEFFMSRLRKNMRRIFRSLRMFCMLGVNNGGDTNSSGRWVRAGWLVQFSCL